jgi:hypothetical protein
MSVGEEPVHFHAIQFYVSSFANLYVYLKEIKQRNYMNKLPLLFVCLFAFALSSYTSANPPVNKLQAKTFINRTAKVVISAQNALKKGKVYSGDFVLAVRHQRWAKKQYALNNFDKAVYHSGRARALALKAIRANKGPAPVEATLTATERAEIAKGPSPQELDESVSKDNGHNQKDVDLVDTQLDMTIQ